MKTESKHLDEFERREFFGDERDDLRARQSIHEGAHAAAHLVMGCPIDFAHLEPDLAEGGKVQPVEGTAVSPADEATCCLVGWAAEEHKARIEGREEQLEEIRMNGGHLRDESDAEAWMARDENSFNLQQAARWARDFVDAHWRLILAIGLQLHAGERLSQNDVQAIGREYGVEFVAASYVDPPRLARDEPSERDRVSRKGVAPEG